MNEVRQDSLLIATSACMSHALSLAAGLIWLDHAHLAEGLALAPNGDFFALFRGGFAGTGYYRPLMSLSLSLDAALGGAPWLYHATTLLWHALASVMTAIAASSLGLSRSVARGAGLLMAVHPLTSLVANAVAFRSESMVTAALLGLVVLHLRGKAWQSGLLLLAGALTKETALVLGPLFVLALELGGSTGNRSRAVRLRLFAAEAAGWLLAAGLRLAFAPAWRAHAPDLLPGEAWGTRLAAFAKGVLAALWPVNQGVCDAFPITPLFAPSALLGAALLAAVAYLAVRRRGPSVFLALTLLPSLQLVPVMRWWSPHYYYLPLAFAAMLAVEALERWAAGALRWVAPAAFALGGLSLLEARRYGDDQRFWSREVQLEPNCREAHYFLGDAAQAAGQLDAATDHYEKALAESPDVLSYVDRAAALQNLGVTRLRQERFDDASDTFRALLDLPSLGEPTRRRITHNLATARLRSGHPEEAAALLEPEVQRHDAIPASIMIRAQAAQALGRVEEARALQRRLQP